MEIVFLQNQYSIIVILVPFNSRLLRERAVFEIFLSSSLKQETTSTLLPQKKTQLWGAKAWLWWCVLSPSVWSHLCLIFKHSVGNVVTSAFNIYPDFNHLSLSLLPPEHLKPLLSPVWIVIRSSYLISLSLYAVVHYEHRCQNKPIKP